MITMAGILAEQPFLAGLRPIHLERLSFYAKRRTFKRDEQIFNEGSRADRFWIIRDGLVQLDAHLPDRPDVAVEALGPGTVLGWSWLLPPYNWHFGATAVEPTLALELESAGVLRLCRGDSELGYELTRRFVAVVVERLQTSRSRVVDAYTR